MDARDISDKIAEIREELVKIETQAKPTIDKERYIRDVKALLAIINEL